MREVKLYNKLRPDSLATIKQSAQSTRFLQVDFIQTLMIQLSGCNA